MVRQQNAEKRAKMIELKKHQDPGAAKTR